MDCIEEIGRWMEANMFKLNDAKTKFMVIGLNHILSNITNVTIQVGDAVVEAAGSARKIWAIMGKHLNMSEHVNKITSSCYYHLRNIGRNHRNLTRDATKTFVHAFVIFNLDNINSLLYCLPNKMIKKPQLAQNQAARINCQAWKQYLQNSWIFNFSLAGSEVSY